MTTTTGTRPAPNSSTPTDAAAGGTVTALWSKIENPPVLWRPLASYYLLLASTALLVGFGVVMVWSSSYVESDQVSFAVVQKQLLWLSIGIPLMLVASRLPVSVFRFLAYPALLRLVCIAGRRPHPGSRRFGERRDALGRLGWPVHDSAFGVRQAGIGVVGRRPARPQTQTWHPRQLPANSGAAVADLVVRARY